MKVFILLLTVLFLSTPLFSKSGNWKQRNYKLNRNYDKDRKNVKDELYTRKLNGPMASEQQKRNYRNRKRISLQDVPEYSVKVNYQPARNFLNRDLRFRYRK